MINHNLINKYISGIEADRLFEQQLCHLQAIMLTLHN